MCVCLCACLCAIWSGLLVTSLSESLFTSQWPVRGSSSKCHHPPALSMFPKICTAVHVAVVIRDLTTNFLFFCDANYCHSWGHLKPLFFFFAQEKSLELCMFCKPFVPRIVSLCKWLVLYMGAATVWRKRGRYKTDREGDMNNRAWQPLSQRLCRTASLAFLRTITQSPEHHKYFWKGTFQPRVVLWLVEIHFINLEYTSVTMLRKTKTQGNHRP